MSNSIFEMNGNAYDARSGALLGNAARTQNTARTQPAMTVHPRPARPGHQDAGASMDGMVKQSITSPRHVSAHQPQSAKTLMRQAVAPPQPGALKITPTAKKIPSTNLHPSTPAPIRVQTPAPATNAIAPKLSSTAVDPIRAHRARVANRSNNVVHFRSSPQQVHTQSTAMPAAHHQSQPQPIRVITPAQYQQTQPTQPQAIQVKTPPQQPRQQSTRPIAAARRPYAQPVQAATQTVATRNPRQEQQEEQDLFAQALAQARSHEEQAPRESTKKAVRRKGSKARKLVIVAASVSVFVVLSGLVAFQNRQQIQLQMASAKAGFAATTPLYMPQGYKLGNLSYGTGSVATSFENNGKTGFSITQKKSNWNSQTLLDNFVATSGDDYKGYQSNGRTVYIYGNGKATWVNGGIWYQIKDAKNLTDEQLVKIATSM